ncbi:hypothetical protein DAI22_06g062200 [Oryza sativa Japonica Group]|nr:hypothetical protein DAI22_06g062200 [Oryza sativa Japonica Group]KAF2925562.1 hypothetical protein DAI22_06g062200 [Oryza sativa Japonica Group]KAF2925563.1 hypothetical protein DAI22_06g062200 [Oryza sativa Japonica Group]
MDEAVNCSTEKQTQDKIIGNIHTALISALSSEQEMCQMTCICSSSPDEGDHPRASVLCELF